MSDRARDHVSDKIDHLFRTVRRDDGREFTYDDVERGTRGRVSRSYVWKLRHGRNRNPSLDVIEALSQFFRVPPSYFFGHELETDELAQRSAEIASLLQDDSARQVARQARGLSPTALTAVSDLIQHLRMMDEGATRRARSDGR
jgi:transcriptional regulator with XRE-family HTH domain